MLTDSQDRANTISQHPHRWHQQNPVGHRTYRLYEGGHGKYGGTERWSAHTRGKPDMIRIHCKHIWNCQRTNNREGQRDETYGQEDKTKTGGARNKRSVRPYTNIEQLEQAERKTGRGGQSHPPLGTANTNLFLYPCSLELPPGQPWGKGSRARQGKDYPDS